MSGDGASALAGRTVILTGAARGIGRECAVRFAREGADLALLDIAADLPGVGYPLGSREQLDHTAELCEREGAAVLSAAVDVRDPAAVGAAVDTALDRFGTVDVLVNNAGIAAPSGAPVHEIAEPDWALMLDVDLSGAWRMTKAVAPVMVARRSGSIVNVASTAGLVGYRDFAAYVTAKHGLVGLTRAAALDYAPHRVRVNALCPGSVRDDPLVEGRMLAEIARSLRLPDDGYEELFLRDQPMNALVEPADVAAAALWLAGDDAVRVTGAVLTVDAGFTVR
ncbi:mycofactocin-coupled SDR family oxidoreductase [Actinomadura sp. NAK00032]|uniref:SDR family oxidoreductase n=1 Tax=Actinomadura sp. NAK00032 TaxID=2742128 RepID=UPI0015928B42|nr:SDR family oxidoreductase [Actinomadura sp. NAK00032]QKW35627.1 mycofactocin-coupled SDR family oxidoreductase [Actinomadura sp. NAK00032]